MTSEQLADAPFGAGQNVQRATIGHRLQRVDPEVDEHLEEALWTAGEPDAVELHAGHDLDARVGSRAQELDDIVEEKLDVDI